MSSRSYHLWFRLAGPGLGFTVFLLVIAGVGTAGPLGSVTLTAPYRKSVSNPTYSVTTGGCGGARLVTLPFWHPSVGVGGFALATHSKKCKSSVGANSDNAVDAQFQVAIRFHGITTGNHLIQANWTLTVNAAEAILVNGSCPYPANTGSYTSSSCYASASADVFGYAYVRDANNGTTIYPSNSWNGLYNSSTNSNSTYCYGGNCYSTNYSNGANGGFSGQTTFSWNFSASGYTSMNGSHRYFLIVSFFGSAVTNVDDSPYGYPVAKATALLNMATLGNGWRLNSITIS